MTNQTTTKPEKKNIIWGNTLFLFLTPFLAITLSIYYFTHYSFEWLVLIPFIIMYCCVGVSITGGYHRLFAHRAYQTNTLLKLFYLGFGAGSFENSALKWSDDHRQHHLYCDTDKDPYNINYGFMWAHMGWILYNQDHGVYNFSKDLKNDKLVMFQHKYYLPISALFGFIIPVLFAKLFVSWFAAITFVGFVRLVLLHHATFLINSLCHCLGRQPYTDTNSAKDSVLMAIFTFGEGYHNFHHYFQADYRNGIRWYHIDPTKWFIQFNRIFGFAFKLKTTPEAEIDKAILEMEEKRVKRKFSFKMTPAQLEQIKTKIIQTQEQIELLSLEMKREYENLKHELPQIRERKIREMKYKIAAYKLELQKLKEDWRFELENLQLKMA